jgi:hypothetical protein
MYFRGWEINMRLISFILDLLNFAKSQGFWFALKYKLGIAKEGKDFFTPWDMVREEYEGEDK